MPINNTAKCDYSPVNRTQDRCYIVNDFGEVGLDHDLIDTVDEEVALMKSGCLCCSIREDLARVLQSLTARCLAAKLVAPNLGARQVAQGPCLWGYRRPLTKTRHEGPVACCRVPCRHHRPDRRLEQEGCWGELW